MDSGWWFRYPTHAVESEYEALCGPVAPTIEESIPKRIG